MNPTVQEIMDMPIEQVRETNKKLQRKLAIRITLQIALATASVAIVNHLAKKHDLAD